jgi:hypothetical protein
VIAPLPRTPATEATILIVALAVFCVAGCHPAGDSHERELLEHAEIPHKPKSFADGVDSLAHRHAAWFGLEKHGHAHTLDGRGANSHEWTELLDVARWLPELAGDTDMPEPEWNQVRAASLDLLATYQRLETARDPALLDLASAIIARLRQLVPSAKQTND